jgi:YVTN family beta-propeller protein
VSPDSSTAYVAEYGSNYVAAINATTYAVTQHGLTGYYVTDLALSPNGETLWVTDDQPTGYVIRFSTSNFQPTTGFLTGTTNPFGLAISPNGTELYVASQGDNKVYIYSTDGSFIKSIKVGTNPADIAFTPNGDVAYVTNTSSSTVSVIDVATNKIKGSPISVGEDPCGINISPSGRIVYVVNLNSVSVIQDRAVVATVDLASYGTHTGYFAALTPDGKYLYVPMDQSDTEDGSVVVIKTGTRTVSTEFTVGIGPVAVAIAPNGEQAYVTNYTDGTVTVVGITE